MATRNLTEAFVLMRNNALQSKHFYTEQNVSDQMALVWEENEGAEGLELGNVNLENASPSWIDALEETQYILSRLRIKIDNLIELHSKHVTRPTLDDKPQEEKQMDQLTREISKSFSNGYRQVQIIKNTARHETRPSERRLALSAVSALSSSLQDLGIRYRTAQNNYLQQVNSREERSRQFFSDDQMFLLNGSAETIYGDSGTEFWSPDSQQMQDSVSLQLEDAENNVVLATQREKEVGHIVKSIAELNYIFKDLGNMVHDQGTVLDRIDYNVEQTQVHVQEGYKQLKKADSYQRANRKMYCILMLAGAIIVISFLLVVFKT